MSTILITGSGSGLGLALANTLAACGHRIIPYDHAQDLDVRRPDVAHIRHLDVLINCAGVNGIEWLENVTESAWDLIMDTNAKGIFRMTQACLPFLIESRGTVLNIVSNAAHVPMTCSAAYNASKAAALMLTKQMARELTKRHGITVFSVSPNKLAGTGMSRQIESEVCRTRGWTAEQAADYQKAALLTGEETPAACVADLITFLLSSKARHKYLSGCDIPYGA